LFDIAAVEWGEDNIEALTDIEEVDEGWEADDEGSLAAASTPSRSGGAT